MIIPGQMYAMVDDRVSSEFALYFEPYIEKYEVVARSVCLAMIFVVLAVLEREQDVTIMLLTNNGNVRYTHSGTFVNGFFKLVSRP